MQYLLLFIFILLTNTPAFGHDDLAAAKKQLLEIYQQYPFTFLCEEPFDEKGFVNIKPCNNCPYQSIKIQWMQIVPLKELLKEQICFKEKICFNNQGSKFGGLRCCKQMHSFVKTMQADLHNMVPEISSLKKLRNTHQFNIISNPNIQRSTCNLKIDTKNKIIQPDNKLRGMIARTYLYLSVKYQMPLSENQQLLYEKWHRTYPPNEWELNRNTLIKTIQGDGNFLIK